MTQTFEDVRAVARGRAEGLGAAQVRELAEQAWWRGDGVTSKALGEEVYRRLHAEDRAEEAALQALNLCLEWVTGGDLVIGLAWYERARRTLGDLDEGVGHGYLRYAEAALEPGLVIDPAGAAEAAVVVAALARTHPESPLTCFARVLEGLARMRAGHVGEGFGALDEAMLEVLAGRVPPLWSGDVYCTVIHVSHELGDWGRMRAWTEALERWASPLSRTFMYWSVTRVHRLELAGAEGDWDEVVTGMAGPSSSLVGSHGWLAAAGFRELGDVLRRRGQTDEAVAAYGRARDLGMEPQPGEAWLAHAAGRSRDAATALRAALEGEGRLERARLLLPAVEIGLAAGDDELAEAAGQELATTAAHFGTPGLVASARHAEGLLAMAHGRADESVEKLAAALGTYREQRLRYAVARVHEHLATARRALGEGRAAEADTATALAIYRDLGAAPDVERLSTRARPGGLTPREEEVLGRVVSGASNREIADELVISEKTVSRHLANIFTKVGVGSRTAAAAWAHANGIHRSPHTRG